MNRILDYNNSESAHTLFNFIFLVLLSVSFVTFDMMISLISISEFILVPLLPILFYMSVRHFKTNDWKLIIGITVFILFNTAINSYSRETFELKPAIYGSVKIIFYTLVFFTTYRLIVSNKLTKDLFNINNAVAVIIIGIGIYINIAIYTGRMPFEFFWTFLRTDEKSYLLRGTDNLIRMRSVFNEPAHLGFYLNTILGINLFRSSGKYNFYIIIILLSGVFFTFSFSSIIIAASLMIIFASRQLLLKQLPFHPIQLLIVGAIVLVVFFSLGDWIELSLFTRFQDIISGQDNSAMERIMGSWEFISKETYFTGLGIGNAAVLYNNYAYFLTEMGIVAFIAFILVTIFVLHKNINLGILLILLNFQKGGYLSSSFTLSLLFIIIASTYSEINSFKRKNEVNS